jgi:TM2 domain-containing membrane protein YozV
MSASISPNEVHCRDCGAAISRRAEICPKCGVRQLAAPGRSRVTAALLAILLGHFGVHKFYLGKPGMGILYLLFCWTFIPTILGFIEGIVYLTMSDAAFDAKYNAR